MKADLLIQTTKAFFAINKRSLCVEGPPGGGKTSLARQSARELRVPYIGVHMPTRLVEDFGVPDIVSSAIHAQEHDDTSFDYRLPAWYPAEGGPLDNGRGGILCFDDRNQADQSLQKVLANIIQEKSLHGVKLAKGWWPMSTGNRQQDRAGANRVLAHLRDRESVITLDTDLNVSTKWMQDHDVAPEVVAFIRFRPGLLHDCDPDKDISPTPRSWVEGVSDILGRIPSEAELECFQGAVGSGAASEFTGFLRIWRDLPDPDTIVRNPTTAPVPTDTSTRYAIAGALAARATPDNFAQLIVYASRMPKEFTILLISLAVRGNDELAETPAYIDWCASPAAQDLMW